MTHTKSTLGRVWARYYNWYGMTGKLRAALLQHGWTEERITDYDQANHLTVNLEHEGENPKVPVPNDSAWLRKQTVARVGQTGQAALKEGHSTASLYRRNPKDTGLVQWPSEKFTDIRSLPSC